VGRLRAGRYRAFSDCRGGRDLALCYRIPRARVNLAETKRRHIVRARSRACLPGVDDRTGSLNFVAAMVSEKGHLGFGLDALGHHVQLQPVGHDEKSFRDRGVLRVARNTLREGLVDLDCVEWKVFEIVPGRPDANISSCVSARPRCGSAARPAPRFSTHSRPRRAGTHGSGATSSPNQ